MSHQWIQHQPTIDHLGVSQKRLRPQSRTICLLQMGHSAPIWIRYKELSRYIKNYQAKIRPLLGMIPLTSATQKQRQIHQNNQRIWRHGCHGAEKLKTCVKTMTPMTTQASTKPPPTSHGGVHYESGWNPRSRCEFLQFLRCKPGISTPSGWWFQPREKWKSQYMGK